MRHGPRNGASKHGRGTQKPMTEKQKRREAKKRKAAIVARPVDRPDGST